MARMKRYLVEQYEGTSTHRPTTPAAPALDYMAVLAATTPRGPSVPPRSSR
jgi:hypothetical protein